MNIAAEGLEGDSFLIHDFVPAVPPVDAMVLDMLCVEPRGRNIADTFWIFMPFDNFFSGACLSMHKDFGPRRAESPSLEKEVR